MAEENKNMGIWDQVCKTDPAVTKQFKGKGGFQGTTPCAQSQRRRVTEMFGPIGQGWGVEDEEFTLVQLSADPHDAVYMYRASFYYKHEGQKYSFPIASSIDLWSYSHQYKNWSKTNDFAKKVRTDALTKGLSELGFNSDIFEGKFDDNKYVQTVAQEFANAKSESQKLPVNMDELRSDKCISYILGYGTVEAALEKFGKFRVITDEVREFIVGLFADNNEPPIDNNQPQEENYEDPQNGTAE